MTISRILVPTDFSLDADAALTYALALAKTVPASVHLLHVVDNPMAAGHRLDEEGVVDSQWGR